MDVWVPDIGQQQDRNRLVNQTERFRLTIHEINNKNTPYVHRPRWMHCRKSQNYLKPLLDLLFAAGARRIFDPRQWHFAVDVVGSLSGARSPPASRAVNGSRSGYGVMVGACLKRQDRASLHVGGVEESTNASFLLGTMVQEAKAMGLAARV